MSYLEQAQQTSFEWFEIWFDAGLSPPYFLSLFKIANKEEYVILDITEKYAIQGKFSSYADAVLFLTEDEYSCVRGREELE